MDGSLAKEVRALLASARAALAEFAEEGIEEIPRADTGVLEPPGEATPREPADAAPSPPCDRLEAPAEPGEAASRTPGKAASPPRGNRLDSPAEPGKPIPAPPRPDEPRSGAQAPSQPTTPLGLSSQPTLLPSHPWGADPSLEQVREALGDCTRCRLSQGRTHIVFGDGNPRADLVFVGEGPGETEDLRGLPFVGRAGDLLTQMIEKGLGIPRSEVYICNVVKCRPPGNRTPLADEVAACSPFLDGQIAALKPRVIVALGKPAASLLLGRDVPITRVRGTWHDYHGIPLMPTFHPAFVLRRYTPETRRLVWEDLKAALARARGE